MRTVLAVIAGYAVIFIFIVTAFTLAYMAGGANFAFQGESLNVTAGWLVMATVMNFVAACLGGWIAAVIAKGKSPSAVKALAALLLVLGLGIAAWNLTAERPGPAKPISELTSSEAAQFAAQPHWYNFLIPFIGFAGVLLGGRGRNSELVGSPAAVRG